MCLKLCIRLGNSAFCMKFGHFILIKMIKFIATRCEMSPAAIRPNWVPSPTNIYTRSAPLSQSREHLRPILCGLGHGLDTYGLGLGLGLKGMVDGSPFHEHV